MSNLCLIEELTVVRDDEMDRDDFDIFDGETYLGVVKDEGDWGQSRGRWWAWSIKTGTVGFHTTRDDAVAAIATSHLPEGPGGRMIPGQQGQRNSFGIMPFARRVWVLKLAASLYDGTRTIAACWKEAFAREWQDRLDNREIPAEDTYRMCMSVLGGEVHTADVFERDGKILDVSPLCRTMDRNNRGTQYTLLNADGHADLTCRHCVEYRERRNARRAAR
jgi:hypothetical protein